MSKIIGFEDLRAAVKKNYLFWDKTSRKPSDLNSKPRMLVYFACSSTLNMEEVLFPKRRLFFWAIRRYIPDD
jgi:hypothetical protein